MHIARPCRRLRAGGLWAAVDREHNRLIARELLGCRRVLDLGCGYGSLTAYLYARGFDVVGIDTDEDRVLPGRGVHLEVPSDRLRLMDGACVDFPDRSFDAVVMRDTLHHLFEETDVGKAFAEVRRVLAPGGRLVVFDPQPNLVVTACRRLTGRDDAGCSAKQAAALFARLGWTVHSTAYTEAFSLPVSGGYVGVPLLPGWRPVARTVIGLDRLAGRLANAVGLGKHLLWRYVLVATPPAR